MDRLRDAIFAVLNQSGGGGRRSWNEDGSVKCLVKFVEQKTAIFDQLVKTASERENGTQQQLLTLNVSVTVLSEWTEWSSVTANGGAVQAREALEESVRLRSGRAEPPPAHAPRNARRGWNIMEVHKCTRVFIRLPQSTPFRPYGLHIETMVIKCYELPSRHILLFPYQCQSVGAPAYPAGGSSSVSAGLDCVLGGLPACHDIVSFTLTTGEGYWSLFIRI